MLNMCVHWSSARGARAVVEPGPGCMYVAVCIAQAAHHVFHSIFFLLANLFKGPLRRI